MPLPSSKIVEKIVPDLDELARELGNIIAASAASAIAERGSFTLGLSGNSVSCIGVVTFYILFYL